MEFSLTGNSVLFSNNISHRNMTTTKEMLQNFFEAKKQLENLVESAIPGYYVVRDDFLMKNLAILSEGDVRQLEAQLDNEIDKLQQDLLEMETEIRKPEGVELSECTAPSSSEWLPVFTSEVYPTVKFIPVPFFSKEHNRIMFHLISSDGECYVSNGGKNNGFKTEALPTFQIPLNGCGFDLQFVPLAFFSEEHKKVMFKLISTDGNYYISGHCIQQFSF
ncbi:unnamed protein product [Hermetia illucens]|uniref:Uncharacterized protein n=1 Tax=Hermetia illucens TaxID=343691 RepID=A0A7R8UBQ1_HERIL|nr:unnamed protein product [Hermetia illucens]